MLYSSVPYFVPVPNLELPNVNFCTFLSRFISDVLKIEPWHTPCFWGWMKRRLSVLPKEVTVNRIYGITILFFFIAISCADIPTNNVRSIEVEHQNLAPPITDTTCINFVMGTALSEPLCYNVSLVDHITRVNPDLGEGLEINRALSRLMRTFETVARNEGMVNDSNFALSAIDGLFNEQITDLETYVFSPDTDVPSGSQVSYTESVLDAQTGIALYFLELNYSLIASEEDQYNLATDQVYQLFYDFEAEVSELASGVQFYSEISVLLNEDGRIIDEFKTQVVFNQYVPLAFPVGSLPLPETNRITGETNNLAMHLSLYSNDIDAIYFVVYEILFRQIEKLKSDLPQTPNTPTIEECGHIIQAACIQRGVFTTQIANYISKGELVIIEGFFNSQRTELEQICPTAYPQWTCP